MDDPPIRVSLSSGAYYERGDRAKVRMRTAQDGYVIVLHADVDGRVRVLFPLDPGDDDFIRGGKEYEIRGRGDREAFFVDGGPGDGMVLAAFSLEPFHYDQFVRGDHWDYRALASDKVRDDPEAGLLDLVTEMADSAHFDYDAVRYTVAGRFAHGTYYGGGPYYGGRPCFGCGPWYGPGWGFGFGVGFGSPYRRFGSGAFYWLNFCDQVWDPFRCDPFFYDPFFYDGFYYSPFYYGYNPYYYSPFYYRPYRYSCFSNPFCYGYGRSPYPPVRTAGFVFKQPAAPPPLVLPRQRAPLPDAGVAQPRSRVNGESGRVAKPAPDRSGETRRRSPAPAAKPERRRSAEPTRRSPPPAAEPRAPKPRAGGRHDFDRLPVDVSPDRNRRLDGGRSWTRRLPVDVSPGRDRSLESARGRGAFQRSEPRAWQAPRSRGFGFSAPSLRRDFGGMSRSPSPSRAAPRRH